MNQQRGFFDEQERLQKLSNQGDPLEKLNAMMDWEIFRPLLRRCFKKEPKGPGGRPPFDYVLMFKILILQRLYNLSDAQMQFQILDRLSFQRFLGQGLHGTVPDEKTIWLFREVLSKRGVIEKLFALYRAHLEKLGLIENNGQHRRCEFCGSATAEKQPGGESIDQRGKYSRRLERGSCEAESEGYRSALDEEERADLLWVQRSCESGYAEQIDHDL